MSNNCTDCLMLIEARKHTDFIEEPSYCRACYQRERAENAKLKDFAQWILDHTTDTCNAGVVLRNVTPRMIRSKAEQALKELT